MEIAEYFELPFYFQLNNYGQLNKTQGKSYPIPSNKMPRGINQFDSVADLTSHSYFYPKNHHLINPLQPNVSIRFKPVAYTSRHEITAIDAHDASYTFISIDFDYPYSTILSSKFHDWIKDYSLHFLSKNGNSHYLVKISIDKYRHLAELKPNVNGELYNGFKGLLADRAGNVLTNPQNPLKQPEIKYFGADFNPSLNMRLFLASCDDESDWQQVRKSFQDNAVYAVEYLSNALPQLPIADSKLNAVEKRFKIPEKPKAFNPLQHKKSQTNPIHCSIDFHNIEQVILQDCNKFSCNGDSSSFIGFMIEAIASRLPETYRDFQHVLSILQQAIPDYLEGKHSNNEKRQKRGYSYNYLAKEIESKLSKWYSPKYSAAVMKRARGV